MIEADGFVTLHPAVPQDERFAAACETFVRTLAAMPCTVYLGTGGNACRSNPWLLLCEPCLAREVLKLHGEAVPVPAESDDDHGDYPSPNR